MTTKKEVSLMKNDEWKRALGLKANQKKEEAGERVFELIDAIKGSLWFKILLGAGGLFVALLIWGLTIEKVCVSGNPDFEKGTGFCAGNGRQDKFAREREAKKRLEREKNEEKQRQALRATQEKKTETEKIYRALRNVCEVAIKSQLREPTSYERINSTIYGSPNGGNKKGVIIEYRARNGFGGMNVVSAGCLTETGRIEDLKLTGSTEN